MTTAMLWVLIIGGLLLVDNIGTAWVNAYKLKAIAEHERARKTLPKGDDQEHDK